MLKRKTSKERGFSLKDMPTLQLNKKTKLQRHNPKSFFKHFDKVAAALLESLVQNDTEAFIEILDAYLEVNKAKVAKKTGMSRSTLQSALSKKGNPTLKTIARIVHESVV
jgi:probable addiction module antidote protein